MRNRISIFLLSVLATVCTAAAQVNSAPRSQPLSQSNQSEASSQTQIDPAKRAQIQRLLELVGTKALMTANLDSMASTIKPLMTNSLPAGEYRDKLVDLFFVKFHSLADPAQFLDTSVVPIYDKHFSEEEIRGLIKFYETPLGQKTVSALPQVSNELREAGKTWGEQIGHQAMQEVLAENPDLAEALKTAKAQAK